MFDEEKIAFFCLFLHVGLNIFDFNESWPCFIQSNEAVFTGSCGPKEKKCIRNEGIYFSLEHIGPAIATFRARYRLMLLIHTV